MSKQIRLSNKLRLRCAALERAAVHSISLASPDDVAQRDLYKQINELLKILNDDKDYAALDLFLKTKYDSLI